MDESLPFPAEPVAADRLLVAKARALADALRAGWIPYSSFLGSLKADTSEIVTLEVEVELPQKQRIHDIRRFERIAAVFDLEDRVPPALLALRSDFPQVPHLNLRSFDVPKSLCIDERPYAETKLHWTPPEFVERIRTWLALTARGELHGEDQPLEPLLLSAGPALVLPADLLSSSVERPPHLLSVRGVAGATGVTTYIAETFEPVPSDPRAGRLQAVATVLTCTPQTHGIIHRAPGTLSDLGELMARAGFDLLGSLRTILSDWQQTADRPFWEHVQDAYLVLIVVFPKARRAGGNIEGTEVRAFLVPWKLAAIGEAVGVWAVNEGVLGRLLVVDDTKQGTGVPLILLNPQFALSRQAAAYLNGYEAPVELRIVAVGAGALGSQVISNLIRGGFGEWVVADKDTLFPHNLARHNLDGFAVGFPKATAMAHEANHTIDGPDVLQPIVADVLNAGDDDGTLSKELAKAELILDMSASVSVARHVALDVDSEARRFSLFLSPSGTDLVLLAEDQERRVPLDILEMQLYRELISNPPLAMHLRPSGNEHRYGASCRDLTSRIPQHLVALHAAVGSQAVRQAAQVEGATLAIWQADPDNLTIQLIKAKPTELLCWKTDGWTIRTDATLLNKLAKAREHKLPNETGGVLIGAFDTQRQIVYVIDTVPSPPDSEEWPTVYIRGCEGLTTRVSEIVDVTDGMLEYVGEWHSHPDGVLVEPSADDRTVLGWLVGHMRPTGLPAMVLIVGEEGGVAVLFSANDVAPGA